MLGTHPVAIKHRGRRNSVSVQTAWNALRWGASFFARPREMNARLRTAIRHPPHPPTGLMRRADIKNFRALPRKSAPLILAEATPGDPPPGQWL